MGFKMRGFNPGKGTNMGSGFNYKPQSIESSDYREKMKRQKELENIEDSSVVSYDKQEDRGLYQRDYMNLEGRKNLPGSRYQSASSVASYGSKKDRDRDAHDEYSGIKDKAAGYDEYSLGAKGAGDEFASEEVQKRNKELRLEAVYNTREANAIGRYKNLEKSYGKGNVPDGLIPDILKEDGARPEFLKDRFKTPDTSNMSRKEMRQQRRQQRREQRSERSVPSIPDLKNEKKNVEYNKTNMESWKKNNPQGRIETDYDYQKRFKEQASEEASIIQSDIDNLEKEKENSNQDDGGYTPQSLG